MSKKNRNKRKQQRRDYHYESTPTKVAAPTVMSQSGSLLTPVESNSVAAKTVSPHFQDDYIRRDIIRIAITLGILAILLLGFVAINHKSTLIQRAGSKFSRFLQL